MQVTLLVIGAWSAANVVNAFAPRRGRWSRWPSFWCAAVTTEFALNAIVALSALVIVGLTDGGLDGPVGIAGLVLIALAIGGDVALVMEARRNEGTMRGVVAELGRSPESAPSPGMVSKAPRFARSSVAVPQLMGRRRGVQRLRNLTYARTGGRTLQLDLILPEKTRPGDQRPVVLHLHGGYWFVGNKRWQGQPLLNHLAADGWVGVNVNYRLSPSATFPDHLVDCKRALAWIRSRIADYGGNPDNVSVAGGSAGGHLATFMALTANQSPYQPGFEDIDTTVRAAVSMYGIYDLTNRLGTWPPEVFERIIEPWVIKGFLAEEPELFTAASPMDHVNPGVPPMLIVHGNRDTIAPVEDARLFAQKLGAESHHPVLYAELAGAQHAFDIFASLRTAKVVESIERFLSMHAK